jgi:2,4-dienoyl-CoA reductase-like NADH-dependent reductase (Old Yellow Enzyme family)
MCAVVGSRRQAGPGWIEKEGYDFVLASDTPLEESTKAPRPLPWNEINQYIQDCIQAAKNALLTGADGVEFIALTVFYGSVPS